MNKENYDLFIQLLISTKRKGMANVIAWVEQSDFFTAPASARFHGSYEGGLLQHSLNVYKSLNIMSKGMTDSDLPVISPETVVITALLHDICKANTYKVAKRWRKNKQNQWEQYDTYEFSEVEPLGHGEKSVLILQRLGLELTEQEIYMIRWHMGGFDESRMAVSNAMSKFPEIAYIHAADLIATNIMDDKAAGGDTNADN